MCQYPDPASYRSAGQLPGPNMRPLLAGSVCRSVQGPVAAGAVAKTRLKPPPSELWRTSIAMAYVGAPASTPRSTAVLNTVYCGGSMSAVASVHVVLW
eukprot:CAMPEP_0206324904 /NCGR_PEP_ID=MMETSP0106_2-20121207/20775_1 /ASSEMBLY_ACC=CAM_ASM_000206 /TAXON_ID=81532 /ORGANISM="Acanthoeca-like sp., Strain 10tr" /LENGTH=97 /DNA_ID=CAMNT_0053757309 /DNA_START=239 /DNA_END=529 /DNA_ORIENTATION=+